MLIGIVSHGGDTVSQVLVVPGIRGMTEGIHLIVIKFLLQAIEYNFLKIKMKPAKKKEGKNLPYLESLET